MKKLAYAILVSSLVLGACGKKAVKDEARGPGAAAPVVSASPARGPATVPAAKPGTPATAGAKSAAGQGAAAATQAGTAATSAARADAAGAGPQANAGAPSAAPAASAAASGAAAPAGGGQGGDDARRAAALADDYVPGKVAAAKPLEGLPSTATAGSGSDVPPKGPAAGLLAERSVFFDFDSNEIPAQYTPLIEAHAKFLSDHPSAKVILQGNTDERGSAEYNLALGERRADAIRRRLQLLGVADGQIETVSYGSEKPKAVGHDESAWKQNRRADIVYRNE
jgi:peptidoglycan-associated lipoprotein